MSTVSLTVGGKVLVGVNIFAPKMHERSVLAVLPYSLQMHGSVCAGFLAR